MLLIVLLWISHYHLSFDGSHAPSLVGLGSFLPMVIDASFVCEDTTRDPSGYTWPVKDKTGFPMTTRFTYVNILVNMYDGQKPLLIICAHAMFSLPRNSDRALFLREITRSDPQIILKAHNKFIFLHPPGKQMDRHEDGQMQDTSTCTSCIQPLYALSWRAMGRFGNGCG
jgi:hypothetical protein